MSKEQRIYDKIKQSGSELTRLRQEGLAKLAALEERIEAKKANATELIEEADTALGMLEDRKEMLMIPHEYVEDFIATLDLEGIPDPDHFSVEYEGDTGRVNADDLRAAVSDLNSFLTKLFEPLDSLKQLKALVGYE